MEPIIRGEPDRSPNTRETEAVYIDIYLCMILHGNDSMRMLRHHVVDLTVTGKGCHQGRLKVNRGSAVWLKLKGLRQIKICVVEHAVG